MTLAIVREPIAIEGELLPLRDGPWMADVWVLDRPVRLEADGSSSCTVDGCGRPSGPPPGESPRAIDVLCVAHRRRYLKLSIRPRLEDFIAEQRGRRILSPRGATTRKPTFLPIDFRSIHPRLANELRYVTGHKVHQGRWTDNAYVSGVLASLTYIGMTLGLESLLDRSVPELLLALDRIDLDAAGLKALDARYTKEALPSIARIISEASVDPWAADRWDRHALRFPRSDEPGHSVIYWSGVRPTWLREGLKRLGKGRLQSGARTFGTVGEWSRSAKLFSRYLESADADLDPSELDRTRFLDFVAWARSQDARRADLLAINCLASLLVDLRIEGIVPGLPESTYLLRGENRVPKTRHPRPFPPDVIAAVDRMIAEDVALEDDVRLLLRVFRAIGPRASEAIALPVDSVRHVEGRGYSLEYFMTKVEEWRRVPVTEELGQSLVEQAARVRERFGDDCRLMFPFGRPTRRGKTLGPHAEGRAVPWAYNTLCREIWLAFKRNGIEGSSMTGERFTGPQLHRFRHTVATELLRSGWSQYEVQRFLGHKSPTMMQAYAEIADDDLARKYQEFVQHAIGPDGDRRHSEVVSMAGVERLRDRLIRTSLPNGYCTLPDKQTCDFVPTPCLSCTSFFRTTPVFLPVHIRQRDETVRLLEDANINGRARVAEGLNQKLAQLNRIIDGLERESASADVTV